MDQSLRKQSARPPAVSLAMGIFVGLVAAAALVVIEYPAAPPAFLAGAAIAGFIGCVLSGWKNRWSLLGSLTGTAIGGTFLYAGLSRSVWGGPDLGVTNPWAKVGVVIVAAVAVATIGRTAAWPPSAGPTR